MSRVPFLAGVRVLELGDGVAGAVATGMLWALGADVTTVPDPASPHRRGRPVAAGAGGSLLAVVLDRGKSVVTGPADLEVVVRSGADGGPFDLVVFDRVGPVEGALADIAEYVRFVDRFGVGAWLTVSAFGLTGGRGEDGATDLAVGAASGMLSAARDIATGRPLKLAGQQSLVTAGRAAALAACHGLDLAADGSPVHLDLSAAEATLAMGPVLEVGGLLLSTGGGGGSKRYGAPASFYDCLDGQIRISAMEDHQWQGVVRAMGSPAWTERFATVQARIDDPDTIDEQVAVWSRTQSKRDAEAVLQANGVPASAVYSPAEILDSPQLRFRGAFEPVPVGDASATVVGLPVRVVPPAGAGTVGPGAAGPSEDGVRRRRLRGLRVLEASRVLAVPLGGALLGAMGAHVTKLEDLPRLDMYRRRGPYIDASPDPEWSAYFALMNHSKSSVAFDVDADRPRLDAIVAGSDVVLENQGRKRAEAIGVAPTMLGAAHPDVLAVSSSGFGQDGPQAEFRAYAYNIQASGALGYLTRNRDGGGAEIDIAWADLLSAYGLATVVAAWAVGPHGNAGAGLDFSMLDLVVSQFNEYLAAAALDPGSDDAAERANDLAPYAPHGVYRTADGWAVIAVDGDEQFAALRAVLGGPDLADPRFIDAGNRMAHLVPLDEAVEQDTVSWLAGDLAAKLRACGVVAEVVATAASLLESPVLTARNFFVPVEHVDWGRRRLVGLPWRRYGGPSLRLGAPPRLGESPDRNEVHP